VSWRWRRAAVLGSYSSAMALVINTLEESNSISTREPLCLRRGVPSHCLLHTGIQRQRFASLSAYGLKMTDAEMWANGRPVEITGRNKSSGVAVNRFAAPCRRSGAAVVDVWITNWRWVLACRVPEIRGCTQATCFSSVQFKNLQRVSLIVIIIIIIINNKNCWLVITV